MAQTEHKNAAQHHETAAKMHNTAAEMHGKKDPLSKRGLAICF